ncbi:MAG: tRNA nucleotidyltransferase (CCA-adding enzyme) [Myxococcota bacterium]|jgi:tRNA nucleotidyltransferase (CCA-adding enzyme)
MDIVTTHLNADLDGLASMVAARLLWGEGLSMVLPGSLDVTARRLWAEQGHHFGELVSVPEAKTRLAAEGLGRLLVVDTARRERLGWLGEWLDRAASVEVWDTHGGEPDAPRTPMPDAGATISPLVAQLLAGGIVPTPEVASLFLAGVHADTGHLRYTGTTPVDHEAAATCLRWGASLGWLERYLPDGLDRRQAQRMSEMAASMQRVELPGAWVALMVLESGERVTSLGDLLTQLRVGEGWPAAVVISVEDKRLSVVARSDGSVDVGAVCERLGGGGHAEAASAGIFGATLSEARSQVIDALQAVEQPQTAGTLCSRQLFTLPVTALLSEAAEALHGYRINALPLVDAAGGVVGVLSRREVDEGLRHGLGKRPAGAISAGPPPVVPAEAGLATVRRVLLDSPTRLVIVGTLTEPQGVVTRTAVFRATLADPPLSSATSAPRPQQLWKRTRRLIGAFAPWVEALGAVAEAEGVRALLIGGCVRDVLLKRLSRDIDVVVVGDAPALARAVAASAGGEVDVFEAFGTAHWRTPDGLMLDFASARTESYPHPGALPVVARGELRQDLFRRDFTINMLALGIAPSERGVLIDPYAGRADLASGLIRVVHGLSFYDDPTRAWRAARFAARLDFHLAAGTSALMHEALQAGVLAQVSDERLGNELHRIFQDRRPDAAIGLLREWGLLRRIHRALPADRELLDRLAATRDAWLQLRPLAPEALDDPGEPLWLAMGWMLSTADREETRRMVSSGRGRGRRWVEGIDHLRKVDRRLVAATARSAQAVAFGTISEISLVALAGRGHLAAVRWWLTTGRTIKPTVTAAALMEHGLAEGPALGRALRAARAAAFDGADDAEQLDSALRAAR